MNWEKSDAATAGPRNTRFGPVISGAKVQFRLWAPAARNVAVVVEACQPVPLVHTADGVWWGECVAGHGSRYRFLVDGISVPDPASRFQPEDVDGPSQVIDGLAFGWECSGWRGRPWRETVLYEVHAGVLGGFDGVRSHLARLAGLGITAIELMPVADFPGRRNWGYDGVLPFAPDSAYGTPDALRRLVDAAHAHGLMVFLDVVYNHFGPSGNYLPAYAPAFFDTNLHTPWGPAIDFDHPRVRQFFIENALYWLEEFRFDGLRLDAVHAIKSRDWLVELASEIRASITDRHVHLVLENEHNDAGLLDAGFDAQWNDDFHNVMHVLLTGESHTYYRGFANSPAEKLARALAEGFVYQGESSPHHGGAPRGTPSAHLPATSFVAFLQNHDQVGNRALGERLLRLASAPAVRAAMALLLLCPQIPMLFMGEELGATDPFLFFTDFHGELGQQIREGRRREFACAPGFTDSVSRSTIPDPNEQATFAASVLGLESSAADEWQNLVSQLLALRHARVVPVLPLLQSCRAQAIGERSVIATWHFEGGRTMTIATNLADAAVTASLPCGAPAFGRPGQADELAGLTTLAWLP
jgi:maltooligosyltrehalose trehalohydrolase